MPIQGNDIIAMLTGGSLEDFSGGGGSDPGTPTISAAQTILDKKILPKVVEILNKYGKIIDYYIFPDYTFDETTNSSTDGSQVIRNVKSIPPYEVEIKYVDGDLIQAGDLLTGVAGMDITFVPDNGIKARFDSVTWRIVRFAPIYSGERIALYLFQLRK